MKYINHCFPNNMARNIKILYDPKYNFHPGFHGSVFDNLPRGIVTRSGNIKCFFEDSVRSEQDSFLSKQFLALGKMEGEGDVIFSPHILLINNQPWIIDLEHIIWLFTDEYTAAKEEELVPYWKRRLAEEFLSSDLCLRILCYSEAAKESVIKLFPQNEIIQNKSMVFYPVQNPQHLNKQVTDKVRLLFICAKESDFYRKGGDIAFNIFLNIRTQFPKLEMILVGEIPFSSKFHKIKEDSGLIHIKKVSHKEMFEKIYPQADILLFPSRADTFGMVVEEAMSCGLTVIASSGNNVFGLSDLVQDGINGFLIHHNNNMPSYSLASNINIEEFVKKTKRAVEDQELRKRIGYRAIKTFEKGPFSVSYMQKQLMEIMYSVKLSKEFKQ